jgi:hypothetical protein
MSNEHTSKSRFSKANRTVPKSISRENIEPTNPEMDNEIRVRAGEAQEIQTPIRKAAGKAHTH